MRRNSTFALLVAATLFLAGSPLLAQQSLSITGASTVQGTGSASYAVEMDNTAPVEGYVVAVCFDNTAIAIDSVDIGAAAAAVSAELFVPEILADGFTAGCVMDSGPPFDGQTIAPGAGQEIVAFTASSILVFPLGDPDVVTGFNFCDATLNNPPLSNILVQGGLSIGSGEGLGLNDAPNAMTIQGIPPASLTINDGSAAGAATGCVSIELDNDLGDVQGFVLAISHDEAALDLVDVNFDGTATEIWLVPGTGELEFQVVNIYPNGGTLEAVLDFDPTSGPLQPVIPAGQDILIANFCYSCDNPIIYPLDGSPAPPAQVTDLTFADGVFGSPALNNVIVVEGQSISPLQNNGQFTCEPVGVPVEDTAFYCGPASLENTAPPAASGVTGTEGETVELCFFYTDPNDNLQGVQIATCHDCNLTFNSFEIAGSIFDEVGAEFFTAGFDNDPDGGCHMTVGILLDALPPFDNQTVPPTETLLAIGCASVTIAAGTCGTDLAVEFCDYNQPGNVLIETIAIIDYESIQNFEKNGCAVSVVPEEVIQRGDCNTDDKVDLADAATILGWQFQGLGIDCPDACDANDDGKINLADSVLIMNYLFLGGAAPADPGPIDGNEGPDPTEDTLGPCNTSDHTC